jgi:hypothetical protein
MLIRKFSTSGEREKINLVLTDNILKKREEKVEEQKTINKLLRISCFKHHNDVFGSYFLELGADPTDIDDTTGLSAFTEYALNAKRYDESMFETILKHMLDHNIPFPIPVPIRIKNKRALKDQLSKLSDTSLYIIVERQPHMLLDDIDDANEFLYTFFDKYRDNLRLYRLIVGITSFQKVDKFLSRNVDLYLNYKKNYYKLIEELNEEQNVDEEKQEIIEDIKDIIHDIESKMNLPFLEEIMQYEPKSDEIKKIVKQKRVEEAERKERIDKRNKEEKQNRGEEEIKEDIKEEIKEGDKKASHIDYLLLCSVVYAKVDLTKFFLKKNGDPTAKYDAIDSLFRQLSNNNKNDKWDRQCVEVVLEHMHTHKIKFPYPFKNIHTTRYRFTERSLYYIIQEQPYLLHEVKDHIYIHHFFENFCTNLSLFKLIVEIMTLPTVIKVLSSDDNPDPYTMTGSYMLRNYKRKLESLIVKKTRMYIDEINRFEKRYNVPLITLRDTKQKERETKQKEKEKKEFKNEYKVILLSIKNMKKIIDEIHSQLVPEIPHEVACLMSQYVPLINYGYNDYTRHTFGKKKLIEKKVTKTKRRSKLRNKSKNKRRSKLRNKSKNKTKRMSKLRNKTRNRISKNRK